jgi:pseudouridylate synthase
VHPLKPSLHVSSEVAAALADHAPVVALESTIITHGLPHPQNTDTARSVEAMVRENGAVPATIAVIEGRITIGLSSEQLEWLGAATDVLKLSRADLPYAVTARRHGSTTVAATMICAHLAGISVFATGGIGGVHRGAETTFDISADLEELSRTPVTVVCSGAKAVLDLPKTLEYLETKGVPVIGYRTDEFPAFWSRSSGLRAPIRLDAPEEIADLIRTKHQLGLKGGVLVANPVPEHDEIPAAEMARHIERALAGAAGARVSGKDVTPFLLARILETTCGRSLAANVTLVRSNAATAAQIASALGRGVARG